jgi:hypothetical protein
LHRIFASSHFYHTFCTSPFAMHFCIFPFASIFLSFTRLHSIFLCSHRLFLHFFRIFCCSSINTPKMDQNPFVFVYWIARCGGKKNQKIRKVHDMMKKRTKISIASIARQ